MFRIVQFQGQAGLIMCVSHLTCHRDLRARDCHSPPRTDKSTATPSGQGTEQESLSRSAAGPLWFPLLYLHFSTLEAG